MHRVRVKICGVTQPDHALAAADLGVDAIGLVFYPPSPRFVDMDAARRIVQVLPPFVCAVGLFMNAEPDAVREVLRRTSIDLLQFHGSEPPEYCAAFGRSYIKAVPMGAGADVLDYAHRFQDAVGLLLDSHGGDRVGGTGRPFDWSAVPARAPKPLVLAGGLDPDNVAEAVQRIRPYGVDVSSGVESVKGVKDISLMQAFVQGVKRGENCA